MPRGCLGDFKTHLKKHALAQSLLSLAFKKIKLIFTRYDFDQSIPVVCKDFIGDSKYIGH
jgi:hypothetical protein